MMRTAILTVCLTVAVVSTAPGDIPSFDRYQVIIDREPFGAPPPPPAPVSDVKTVPLEESFARNFRLSMIIKDDETGEIKVGVYDEATKVSLTLRVGEMDEGQGIELVSADYEAEEAVLRKGTEEAVVKLATGTIKPVVTPGKKGSSRGGGGPPQLSSEKANEIRRKLEEMRKRRGGGGR